MRWLALKGSLSNDDSNTTSLEKKDCAILNYCNLQLFQFGLFLQRACDWIIQELYLSGRLSSLCVHVLHRFLIWSFDIVVCVTTPPGWDACPSQGTQHEATRSITTPPGWDASPSRGTQHEGTFIALQNHSHNWPWSHLTELTINTQTCSVPSFSTRHLYPPLAKYDLQSWYSSFLVLILNAINEKYQLSNRM